MMLLTKHLINRLIQIKKRYMMDIAMLAPSYTSVLLPESFTVTLVTQFPFGAYLKDSPEFHPIILLLPESF
jgi:hypothetical protein